MTGAQHREAPEKLRHVARFRSVIPQDLVELRGEPWAAYGSRRCYMCYSTPQLPSILVVFIYNKHLMHLGVQISSLN